MPSELYVKGSTSGAKAQNAEWFASDLAGPALANKAQDFIIEVEVSTTAAELEYTLDSGSTWLKLITGTLAVNTPARYRILVKNGDNFNMRAPNASGTTVDRCDVVADQDA